MGIGKLRRIHGVGGNSNVLSADPAYLPDPLVVLAFEERTTTPSVVSRRDRIFAWEEKGDNGL